MEEPLITPTFVVRDMIKMFRLFVLALFHNNVSGSVFTEVVIDLVQYYARTSMVTEFSCNINESTLLLKKLTRNGHQTQILPVHFQNIDYPIPPNHQVFVLNLQCQNSSLLLGKVDQLKFFASPFRWILYHDHSDSLQNILNIYFEELNILVDSDVTLSQLQHNNTVLMKKIYKRRHNHSIEIEEIGYWTKTDGFTDYAFEKNTARRRGDLKGTQLNTCIVITHNDSLNHLTDKRDKHIDSIAKVNYVLVEHLKDVINATLNYSVEGTWGYKNDKSEWSGMIGQLTRNEADFGGTALFFTIDRVDIIDYVSMTTPTRSKFVFRQPKLSYVTNVFILPFDNRVWASTVCLVIIVGLVLYVIMKWEWKKWNSFGKSNAQQNIPELKDSIEDVGLFAFGALCQQGATAIPFSIPGRITTVLLYISLMFLYTSYSANIVALLQSSSHSIQTLEDLLTSRLQVGVDDTVFNRFYFPNATEPVRRALYLQKVAPRGKKDNFMSIEEGVRRLRKGLFAFHMETGPGYKIVSETFQEGDKCGLQEIQFLQVVDPWLAVQKNSSYKEMIKIGLRKIQESGIQSREVGQIYTKKPVCTSRGSTFISVGLVDCYPAAVVLAGGLIASFSLFLLETYLHYRRNFLKTIKNNLLKSAGFEIGADTKNPWPYRN